jgi:hypothetical protein
MSELASIEQLLQRAQWEATHARPLFAYRLYMRAWSQLADDEARAERGPSILNAALDLCLDYTPKDAAERVEVANAILAATHGTNARALVARGVAISLSARRQYALRKRDAAWEQARAAEADLRAAAEIIPFDADALGSLGGLYKRMGDWARAENAAGAREYDSKMLDAYLAGAQGNRDAYCLLNYLEYRAVVAARLLSERTSPPTKDAGEHVQSRPPHYPPILQRDAERDERRELERALEVRRQQFQRGEDAPWAAFDLARGQHYLHPDVYRFLSDLGVAVKDAKRVAYGESDRWMVESAQRSLNELYEAGYPLDGLEDAMLLLAHAATAEGWTAGTWEPLARADDYLVAELRAARDSLLQQGASQLAATAGLGEMFKGFRARAEQRWSREDEERFQKALAEFSESVEAPAKKHLRVLWKLFGEEALKWGLVELPVLLLGGPLPAVGVLVGQYMAKFAADRISEQLETREARQ